MNKKMLKQALHLIFVIVILSCAHMDSTHEFSYVATPCEDDVTHDNDISKMDVSKIQWIDSHTFRIGALILLNCAYKISKCKIEIERDIISIKYKTKNPDNSLFFRTVAACNCTNKLIVEINNIEQKNYKINLTEI